MKYVIIGGGVAGTTVAEGLRKLNSKAEITIIEQEPHRLYSKVLLARYITDKLDRDRLFLKKENWYPDNNIELMSSVRVVKIDSKNKFVETSDSREIPYDKLIIATGQQPRLLETDMPGIVYLRSLDDAEILKSAITQLRSRPVEEQRMIVVGGSFVSMEYVHIAQELEIPISIILRSGGFWSKILSEKSQEVLLDKMRALGVEIYINETFEILGESEFKGVKLSNGDEIQGSILAVGTGVEIDSRLLIESELKVNRGLVCDSKLITLNKHIYSVGDVCEFDDVIMNRVMHIGNWTNAIQQGRCVADNIEKDNVNYQFVSSYATRIGNTEITFIGDTDKSSAEKLHRVEDENVIIELFERDNRTVGAVVIGSAKERIKITKAIQNKELYEYQTSIG